MSERRSAPGANGPRFVAVGLVVLAVVILLIVVVAKRMIPVATHEGTHAAAGTEIVGDEEARSEIPPEPAPFPTTLEELADAAAALEIRVKNEPDNAMIKLELAEMLIPLDREPEAGQLVLDAYEVAPDDPAIVYNLAMYLIAKKQWDEAEVILGELLAMAPENNSARLNLERIRQARAAEEAAAAESTAAE